MSSTELNPPIRTQASGVWIGRRLLRTKDAVHESICGQSPCLLGSVQLAASVFIALICAVALAGWFFYGGYQSRQSTIIIILLGILLVAASTIFGCCAAVHLSRIKRAMKQENDVQQTQRFAESVSSPPSAQDDSIAVHLRILRIQRSRQNSLCSQLGLSVNRSKTIVSAELTLPASENTPLSTNIKYSVSDDEESIDSTAEVQVVVTSPS
uniref:Uncharacterized protein n=1 Tax=Plectus sambesii TaxID=2011161 RepID=A0A914WK53_9BILA